MKTPMIVTGLLLALTVAGCGKKKDSTGTNATAENAAVTNAAQSDRTKTATPQKPLPPPPSYITANAQNAPAENVAGEADPFLTQQLKIFMQQKSRMPQSFQELANARLDSVPRPPAGKKWVIDAATAEVKAVAAQ